MAQLFGANPSLLAATVRAPANLASLLDWLRGELGLSGEALARLAAAEPRVLQADLERELKPRVAHLRAMGLSPAALAGSLRRYPQLLLVEPASLRARADHLQRLGLGEEDLAHMFARDPGMLIYLPSRMDAGLVVLRRRLPLAPGALAKVVAKGGALKLSAEGLEARLDTWEQGLGFAPAQLARMLDRFPRLLLYPVDAPKYRAK